jgi:glucose-1-phosphate adenylyltransferase
MDVREMIAFHLASGADVSVSAIPVPTAEANAFGVLGVDNAGRIRRFDEKPAQPAGIPGRRGVSLVSMGNYLFDPQVLLEALDATHAAGGVDFGRDLLPPLVRTHRLMAYDFATNRLADPPSGAYWRDVGTIDAYFAAHMDMLVESPPFQLADARWPIHCHRTAGAPGTMGAMGTGWEGARIGLGAELTDTVLRPGVEIGAGASLARCIVAEHARIGARCRLRNVIVDAGNWLPDGLEVGFDREADARRWPASAGGVVVIPHGAFPARPFQRVPAAPSIHRPVFTPAETLDWDSLEAALQTTASHPGAVKPPSRPAAARDEVVAG